MSRSVVGSGGGALGGLRSGVLVAVMLALPGCLAERKPTVAAPSLDSSESLLMEAALRAETALTRLARIEGAPSGSGEIPRIVPAGLLKRVDIAFVGPVETLAEELAGQAGFAFERSGAAPARPVMVEVRARSRPLIMVLRDAGVQAGSAAALVVDPERRLVLLEWTGGGK